MHDLLLFFHVIAMTFWLGGQLFLTLVAVPVLRGGGEQEREITIAVARRYGTMSIVALMISIATGITMMVQLELDVAQLPALRHKLELLGLMLVATVAHTIAGARGYRRVSRIASFTGMLLSLGVVWFGTQL